MPALRKASSQSDANTGTSRRRARTNARRPLPRRYNDTVQEQGRVPDRSQKQGNRPIAFRKRGLVNQAVASNTDEKLLAVSAGIFILWAVMPFYALQVLLWIGGLAMIGTEEIIIVNMIVPGEELFVASYIMIAVLGLCSMFYAVIMFNLRGIDCFSGHRSLYFLLCLMGYFVFFINLAPWTLIWVVTVIWQKKAEIKEQ